MLASAMSSRIPADAVLDMCVERQTQSQLVELVMQPLLCHTLHSWVLSPAAREREEALALGRQHLAQNQEAFDVAELAHMRRCAHRERTQGALEQCQTTAALRQQYQSKVGRILFIEARVAELRQEAAVRGPQRHQERQHEADQVANNVSTPGRAHREAAAPPGGRHQDGAAEATGPAAAAG